MPQTLVGRGATFIGVIRSDIMFEDYELTQNENIEFEINTNGINVFTLDQSGNLSIAGNFTLEGDLDMNDNNILNVNTIKGHSVNNLLTIDETDTYITGNVGIGTNNPTSSLHIKKNETTTPFLILENTGQFFNNDTILEIISQTSGGNPYLKYVSNNTLSIGYDRINAEYSISLGNDLELNKLFTIDLNSKNVDIISGDLVMNDNDILNVNTIKGHSVNNLLTIDETDTYITGNVGIGTNNPGTYKMRIDSNLTGGTPMMYLNNTTTGDASLFFQSNNITKYTMGINQSRGNFEIMSHQFLDDLQEPELSIKSGNVGIGTNNPVYKLDVNGNIRTGEQLIFSRGGIQDPYIANTGDSKDLMFYTVNTERMRIEEGGNVGIGTNNPTQKLQVQGDALIQGGDLFLFDTNEKISSDGTDMTFNVGGSEVVRFKAGGNVGIGTTNPLDTLDLDNGALRLAKTNSDKNYIRIYGSADDGIVSHYDNTIESAQIKFNGWTSQAQAQIEFYTKTNAGSLTLGLFQSIDANVGIGTNNPTQKLQVQGDALIQGGDLFLFDTNEKISSDGTDMTFNVGGSEVVRFKAGGNVGIGTTNPGNKLTILNTTSGDSEAVLIRTTPGGSTTKGALKIQGNDGNSGLTLTVPAGDFDGGLPFNNNASTIRSLNEELFLATNDATNGDIIFLAGAGTSEHMRIDASGNVGIGTTNPTQKLQVQGDALIQGGDLFLFDTNEKISSDGTDMTFNVGGSEVVRFEAGGNVGIGTNNPGGNLHISSGTAGDCVLILEADTDNNNENDNPYILFRQDGGIDESAIYHLDNALVISNSVTGDAGIQFHTGAVNGYTNAVERMRIDASGNVGIGTNNPLRNLHVLNEIAFHTNNDVIQNEKAGLFWHTNDDYAIYEPAGAWSAPYNQLNLSWLTGMVINPGTDNTYGRAHLGVKGAMAVGSTASYWQTSNHALNNPNGLVVEGNVGIGTTNPIHPFQVGLSTKHYIFNKVYEVSLGETINSYRDVCSIGNQSRWSGTIFVGNNYTSKIYHIAVSYAKTSNDVYKRLLPISDTGIRTFDYDIELLFKTTGGGNTSEFRVRTISSTQTGSRDTTIAFVGGCLDGTLNFTDLSATGTDTTDYGYYGGSLITCKMDSGTSVNTGKVGIGTNLPLQDFHLEGNSYFNGNVGIGTTNPLGKLHVQDTGGDIITVEATSNTSRSTIKFLTNGNDWELGARGSSGNPNNSFYLYDNNSFQYRIVVDSSGNVGIGTNLPLQDFHLEGNSYFNGNVGIGTTNPGIYKMRIDSNLTGGSPTMYLNNTTTGDASVFFQSNDIYRYTMGINQSRGNFEIMSHQFLDDLQEPELSIKSGNVGIGTNNPGNKLTVWNTTSGDTVPVLIRTTGSGSTTKSALKIQGNSTSAGLTFTVSASNFSTSLPFNSNAGTIRSLDEELYLATNDATNGDIIFLAGAGTSEHMRIDASGNVGIGTNNPTQKLQVQGDALIQGGDLFLFDTNEKISSDGTDMTFHTNNTEQMKIDSNGDIYYQQEIVNQKDRIISIQGALGYILVRNLFIQNMSNSFDASGDVYFDDVDDGLGNNDISQMYQLHFTGKFQSNDINSSLNMRMLREFTGEIGDIAPITTEHFSAVYDADGTILESPVATNQFTVLKIPQVAGTYWIHGCVEVYLNLQNTAFMGYNGSYRYSDGVNQSSFSLHRTGGNYTTTAGNVGNGKITAMRFRAEKRIDCDIRFRLFRML